MLLFVLVLLIGLATRVLTVPSLNSRQEISSFAGETNLASADFYPAIDTDATEGPTIADGLDDGTNGFDYAEPWEIASAASKGPPAGFHYTTEPYDGYCLNGYQNCKICQKDRNECYPAKRTSYTDNQGRTAWRLCETDVQTPPCTPYDNTKVFNSD